MLSFKKFEEIIEFIKKKSEQEHNFCSALEAMTPDTYVDAFIYSEYETKLIDLLNVAMNLPPYDETISYFVYDLDFGKKYHKGCFTDTTLKKNIDLSTIENLYNYIVKVNEYEEDQRNESKRASSKNNH